MVESSLEDIRNGEIFQIVLSRYEDYSVRGGDVMNLYMRLADLNPSPYMYITKFGDKYIVGTSLSYWLRLTVIGWRRTQ